MTRLGLDEAALEARGALWTAREILQQPAMLLRTHQLLEARRSELEHFLQPLLARPELRVILAGAGTSALIGECLSPFLRSWLPCRVEAIATTDIASAPELYLQRGAATLLVSFARSGNSPESVATAELADRFVDETHHLVITCNPDGALAKHGSASSRGHVLLLPEETHDKSFAMTSSFSCMTYAALAALTGIERMRPRIEVIARAVDSVLSQQAGPMQVAAEQNYERVVFLGSHVLKGLAGEAALKLLELTDGAVISACESPMGFRHGPKTIVNERTLVVVFLSNHPHTRQYDLDMLDELRRDATAARVLAVSAQSDGARDPADCVHVPHLERADDVELLFPYIAAPQLLAFHESLRHGLSPDNPSRSGTVSRVVQGVRIHAVR
jgi:D-galactosamine 6-phosphate deaminase/isomerase